MTAKTLASVVKRQKKRSLKQAVPLTLTWPELIALELMKPAEERVKVPLPRKTT